MVEFHALGHLISSQLLDSSARVNAWSRRWESGFTCAFSLNGEICIDPFRFPHVSGTIRGMGKETFPSDPIGSTNNSQSGIGFQVRPYLSSTCTHKKEHGTYPYHISHITVLNLNLETSPITTPYKSGENRTTTNQNGNIQRGTCSADILTYSVHTYLPTYLSSSSFHLPSSIFSFHFSFSCPILRFMLHVSCFMLYVFFVSFFVLHRSIDYLFTQRSTECFLHITEYLCFCT